MKTRIGTAERGMKWPADTRDSQKAHALKHVAVLEFAISACQRTRMTAVQAGGNVGLWPIRMAKTFERVITFEPEPITRACLIENTKVFANIEVRPEALGAKLDTVAVERRSLGSHRIVPGKDVDTSQRITVAAMIALDDLALDNVDLIQLDIEGYELPALQGAAGTIARSHPVIQLEMAGFAKDEGAKDKAVQDFIQGIGYREHSRTERDAVFVWGG